MHLVDHRAMAGMLWYGQRVPYDAQFSGEFGIGIRVHTDGSSPWPATAAPSRRVWWGYVWRIGMIGPDAAAAQTLVNHPLTGPVVSGPQQVPFFCETQVFGLAPASQPFCAAPTKVDYLYWTTAGTFAPLADPASRPADLAQVPVDGRVVPYIVRRERGTIDRAVYEIAALYDGADPSPLRAALADGCWTPAGERIVEPATWHVQRALPVLWRHSDRRGRAAALRCPQVSPQAGQPH